MPLTKKLPFKLFVLAVCGIGLLAGFSELTRWNAWNKSVQQKAAWVENEARFFIPESQALQVPEHELLEIESLTNPKRIVYSDFGFGSVDLTYRARPITVEQHRGKVIVMLGARLSCREPTIGGGCKGRTVDFGAVQQGVTFLRDTLANAGFDSGYEVWLVRLDMPRSKPYEDAAIGAKTALWHGWLCADRDAGRVEYPKGCFDRYVFADTTLDQAGQLEREALKWFFEILDRGQNWNLGNYEKMSQAMVPVVVDADGRIRSASGSWEEIAYSATRALKPDADVEYVDAGYRQYAGGFGGGYWTPHSDHVAWGDPLKLFGGAINKLARHIPTPQELTAAGIPFDQVGMPEGATEALQQVRRESDAYATDTVKIEELRKRFPDTEIVNASRGRNSEGK